MNRLRAAIRAVACHEDVDFLLTNRIPRRLATRCFGWFSKLEQPLVRDLSIGVWRLFSDLNLDEAREEHFRSLHDCFIRRLKDDARHIESDQNLLVSPCDAIVARSSMDRRSSSSHRTDSPWWTVFSKVTGFVWVSRSCGLPTPMAGRVPPPESEPTGGQQWRERIPSQRPSSTVANPPLTTFLPSHHRTRIGRQFHLEDLSRAAHGTAA